MEAVCVDMGTRVQALEDWRHAAAVRARDAARTACRAGGGRLTASRVARACAGGVSTSPANASASNARSGTSPTLLSSAGGGTCRVGSPLLSGGSGSVSGVSPVQHVQQSHHQPPASVPSGSNTASLSPGHCPQVPSNSVEGSKSTSGAYGTAAAGRADSNSSTGMQGLARSEDEVSLGKRQRETIVLS